MDVEKQKTLKEITILGGQARWKGISKKKRSEMMRELVNKRWQNDRVRKQNKNA